MSSQHFDLCIIGGGINGAGIARDAAGRGFSVLLVEAADLGGATSGASSKLIHGGLRYLEHGAFGMVRGALKERERLMGIAPHLITPMEFILPYDQGQRPEWIIRLGLFLYDNLVGVGAVPGSRRVDFTSERGEVYGAPLGDAYEKGFSYYDGWCDDTRLVVLNAVDAAEKGAQVLTRTICTSLAEESGRWRVGLKDAVSGAEDFVSASMVVNATGPWVRGFLNALDLGQDDPDLPDVRLVKGSHIILPRRYEGAHSYLLQQPDGRIVFVIPYERDYTLVGTTEVDFDDNPAAAQCSDDEAAYLCAAYSRFFKKHVTPKDMIFTYSGVRPLVDDGHQKASDVGRGYRIYHHKRFAPPLLSVFGGKLTTYRAVAEDVVNRLVRLSGRSGAPWTAAWSLPGGDLGNLSLSTYEERQKERYSFLPDDVLFRYVRSYGSRMDFFLQGAEDIEGLGVHYGDGVFEAEVFYLVRYEWARTLEDVLWRRSKLGLHVSDETVGKIDEALAGMVG
ncbi:MAG: glycerol-3-phosphate dehydrogenase [Alphaproteobacteria bacterium]|nr:glycerol-3-phosphate dehydrogenase [Alphaproteobacteria bacterium]